MTGKEEVITQKDVKAHQHVFRVYLWWPSSNVEKKILWLHETTITDDGCVVNVTLATSQK